jgi:tetratricopeptide (TPR) repeat protein
VAADERPKPAAPLPPYQQLLRGPDAGKAKSLEAQLAVDWAAGHFEEALRKAEALATLRQKAQGADHWQTADAGWDADAVRRILKQDARTRAEMAGVEALDGRAEQLEARGQYGEALILRQRLLRLCGRVLGERHSYTAECYSKLVRDLHAQGHYAAAELPLQRALAIRREALGEHHPATATSYIIVGINLDAQGKHAAAEPLLRRALAVMRELHGEEHPDTAGAYSALGGNLHAQGKYAVAEPLLQKALAIERKVLGEGHPETAKGYNNLAVILDLKQAKIGRASPRCSGSGCRRSLSVPLVIGRLSWPGS